ncbi:TPD1 protein homolog 1-like [Quercus suber]|uniref:TPD1 protein homolog 1-like n=1 Tax=Quercus suber TaxID=58331 RepID=UPI000D2DF75F|nr:tpd1 protein like 1 [Quercus suber]
MASVKTMFIAGFLVVLAVHNVNGTEYESTSMGIGPRTSLPNQKLHIQGGDCLKNYIQVTQGTTGNLPSGTPIYSVQITNECPRDCSIAQIHLSCDSFASELLMNPMIFRKLGINDCLVNNGKPLANGASISFKYASNAKFPLAVSSLTCSP